MACVRLKRLLSQDPAEAILISHKRRCVAVGGGDAFQEVKEVFRFAGTVQDKDEPVENFITRAATDGEMKLQSRKSVKMRPANILTKSKEQQKLTSKENRFQLVSTLRGITNADLTENLENNTASNTFEETMTGLYKLYDVEHYEKPRPVVKIKEPETISCNGVPLQYSEKLVQQSAEPGYVYDLYFADSNSLVNDMLQEPVRIEYCDTSELDLLDNVEEEDPFAADDDDDSNDENNWRNDYPEEDEEFEKQYDFYERDEELLERMTDFMIAARASSEEDDDLSTSEEHYEVDTTDKRLHGEAYANFKTQMKAHLKESESNDMDSYKNPVLSASHKDEMFRW